VCDKCVKEEGRQLQVSMQEIEEFLFHFPLFYYRFAHNIHVFPTSDLSKVFGGVNIFLFFQEITGIFGQF